ncbi:MAG: hypothetical protein M3Y07_08655 [Acidobacteriota bacterium]|nr:hypothetical protein [Acidobacteriota bacterium]
MTGHATIVASTALGLSTIVNVNGTVYAFNAAAGEVDTLDWLTDTSAS